MIFFILTWTLLKKTIFSTEPSAEQSMNYLGMSSYARRHHNLLAFNSRVTRTKRCLKLLNHLKNKGGNVYVFVNIKKLLVDEVVNELLS